MGPHGRVLMAAFQGTWLTPHWELRVDVGNDSTTAPLAAIGGPSPPERAGIVTCNDTVAGRPMHIVTYRQPSNELHGTYVVVADWPLVKGSWLRIGGVANDSGAQHRLEAIVHTLTWTNSATASATYHPTSPCAVTDHYFGSWSSHKLRYAPVSLSLPPDAQSRVSTTHSVEVLNWSQGKINLMYRLLETPGWQLAKPDAAGATWCQMRVAGHRVEVAVDSVTPEHGFPMMAARAYVELSRGVVLAVESHLQGAIPDGQQEFMAALASIRPSEP